MGYGMDEHYDEALDNDYIEESQLAENFRHNIWTQKDGTEISLFAMRASHINNAVRHIQRGGQCFGYGQKWLPRLQNELRRRANSRTDGE